MTTSRRRAAKVLLLVVVALLVLPIAAYRVPALAGHDRAYIVLSGSMEPVFGPGDIIFSERVDPEELGVGDVVTFRQFPGSDRLYTHRIIAVEHNNLGPVFTTKGDANEDPDPAKVPGRLVTGRYGFHLPAYGHLVALASTRAGMFLLIFVPGFAIIGSQLWTIVQVLARSHADEPYNPPVDGAREVLVAHLEPKPGRGDDVS